MKRKIAFALVSIAAAGGAWSCITWGQDPFGPLRVARPSVSRTFSSGGGAETVTIAGTDIGPNFEDNVATFAGQLKSAEGAEKESILAKLKSEVGQQFDRRQDAKGKELKALEEQLAKLKEIHSRRTQQRDQIIADRVQQIVRDVEGLGWGTDSIDMSRLRTTQSSDDLFVAPAAASAGWARPPADAAGSPRRPATIEPRSR